MRTNLLDEKQPSLVQRPLLGIALYLVAIFLIIVMNAFVKKAAEFHDPVETVFYRGIVAMVLLFAYAAYKRQFHIYKTERLKSHIGRSLAGNIGVVLVFWSYSIMPMADVTALLFAAPLMVTLLSTFILKEKVGPYRWLAVIIGFAGVMLISQPSIGLGGGNYGILICMSAALSMALVQIFLRELGKTEDALTTVFYFLSFGIVASGIYMIFKGNWPHPNALIPLAGAGIAAGLQLIIKTQAFRLAEASLLSPFSFTSIIWATVIGWMFWDQLPDMLVIYGTAIVVASNLFILWREKQKKP